MRRPKPFISSGLALGAAVHHALADFHRSIQSGKNLGPEQVHDVLMTTWDEMENREPIQYRDGEDRAKSLDQAVALVDLYLNGTVPDCVVAVGFFPLACHWAISRAYFSWLSGEP